MTQVTSLPLSKELYEKRLRIETEKWHILIKDVTDNNKEKWIVTFNIHSAPNWKELYKSVYSAYSTDELLAVMPDEIEIKKYKAVGGNGYEVNLLNDIDLGSFGYCDLSLPEALGKMILWLLDNGYKYEEKEKCLIKKR